MKIVYLPWTWLKRNHTESKLFCNLQDLLLRIVYRHLRIHYYTYRNIRPFCLCKPRWQNIHVFLRNIHLPNFLFSLLRVLYVYCRTWHHPISSYNCTKQSHTVHLFFLKSKVDQNVKLSFVHWIRLLYVIRNITKWVFFDIRFLFPYFVQRDWTQKPWECKRLGNNRLWLADRWSLHSLIAQNCNLTLYWNISVTGSGVHSFCTGYVRYSNW